MAFVHKPKQILNTVLSQHKKHNILTATLMVLPMTEEILEKALIIMKSGAGGLKAETNSSYRTGGTNQN